MAPAYKLTYFNLEGLAEAIRMLFSYGDIPFEDVRIEREDWLKYKPDMPFGTVPLLEHNGKRADQSVAILRYVAKQVKLNGKNDWEDLEIDAIADSISDWRLKVSRWFRETDEKVKKSLEEQALKDNEFYMNRFTELTKKNNGYLVLGRLTWADVLFASLTTYMFALDKYPELVALRDKVFAVPNIKKWMDKRPKNN